MKKVLLAVGLLATASLGAVSQSNVVSVPRSFIFNQTIPNIPVHTLEKPDVSALLADDAEREKKGVFYRTGVFIKPQQELTEAEGTWVDNTDGTVSWFIRFAGSEAKALGVYFDHFAIPAQGSLFVYNQDKSHVVGPYTAENSISGDMFATAPVVGDEITLEYNGPAESAGEFKVNINELAYMYRNAGFGPRNASEYGDSDPCEVNANCSEGSSWDAQRRSVVKIIVRDGNSAGLCSGAMVNTTNGDCTPYVLTANHCGGGATTANFKQWVFYFNFETPGCSNPGSATNLDDQVITGCLKMANSSDVSDVILSDFMLVHLKNRPATSFNAFLAGWSRSATAATSGVSIHHPAGDVKKISTFTTSATNSGWSGGNFGRHWGVKWSSTTNGHGVTEGGSSGSPLFDQLGRIVGDLSGGSSFCTNPNGQDVYGKFIFSWDQSGTTSNRRLKDWLDKTNLNTTTINGKEMNSCAAATLPTVDFVASNVTPSVGETVTLTNQSTGSAFGYQWQISPATHTFVNGTSQFSENPQVQFSTTASYTVHLNVFNAAGYGVKTRTAYIKPHSVVSVNENVLPEINIYPNPSNGSFQISMESNPVERIEIMDMNGKVLYTWTGKKPTVQIDVHEFATGIYIVKIESGQATILEKLVLN